MTDTIEQQFLEWQALEERATHCDTMKPLSPLESEWLDDYRAHFRPLAMTERYRLGSGS